MKLPAACLHSGRGDPPGHPHFLYLTISPQLLQQRLGLLEVSGVKALGEPAVDRGQQLVGLGALALVLPQAAQTHRRPQLQRFRLLAAGNVEGLLKTGFRLIAAPRGLLPAVARP